MLKSKIFKSSMIVIGSCIISLIIIDRLVFKETLEAKNKVALKQFRVEELSKNFNEDSNNFNLNYLGKTLIIEGNVTSISDSIITLNNKVVCGFNFAIDKVSINQNIEIKGKYIGHDELFDNLKFNECVLE